MVALILGRETLVRRSRLHHRDEARPADGARADDQPPAQCAVGGSPADPPPDAICGTRRAHMFTLVHSCTADPHWGPAVGPDRGGQGDCRLRRSRPRSAMDDDEPVNVTIKRAPSGQSKPRPGGSAFDSSARKGKVGASLKRASYFYGLRALTLSAPRLSVPTQEAAEEERRRRFRGRAARGRAARGRAAAGGLCRRGRGLRFEPRPRRPRRRPLAVRGRPRPWRRPSRSRAAADRQGLLHGR